jgi:hypothetical protein
MRHSQLRLQGWFPSNYTENISEQHPTSKPPQPPASSPASAPEQPPAPQPRAIDFATEWLDEDGRVCPKNVDYATQCPITSRRLAAAAARTSCAACATRRRRGSLRASGWRVAWLPAAGATPCAQRARVHSTARTQRMLQARISRWRYGARKSRRCCAVAAMHTRLSCDALNVLVLQGVHVEYLQWLQTTFGASIGRATVEQVCQMYIRPRTSRSPRGSVAQELVDSARTRRHVAPASWFISHTCC